MSIILNNDVIDKVKSHLQKIKNSLACSVCDNLPIEPLRITSCSHIFCNVCIQTKIDCPICKKPFSNTDLLDSPYTKRQIQCLFHLEDIIQNENNENLLIQASRKNIPVAEFTNSIELNPINLPNGFISTRYPKIIWNDNSNKIDTKKRNKVGETILHKACISGKIDVVINYINTIKNVNIPDNYNWTPLHEACKAGHLDIVKLLLEAGAIVNVPSMSYDTPLHLAVKHMHSKIIEVLMEYGAIANAKTYEGVTPLDHANDQLKQIMENTQPIKITQPIVFFPPFNLEIISTSNVKTKLEAITNDKFSLKVTESVSKNTSFLIVPSKVCEISLQTLTAILYGTWIVTIDWYTACTINKEFINPVNYEITGTVNFPTNNVSRKSRLCRQLLGPHLFQGCNFYVFGQKFEDKQNNLTLTKQDVTNLILAGNGNILKRCPRPESLSNSACYPFHARGKLEKCANYIIYLSEPLQPEYRFPEIHTLHVSWLLKCIENYEIFI